MFSAVDLFGYDAAFREDVMEFGYCGWGRGRQVGDVNCSVFSLGGGFGGFGLFRIEAATCLLNEPTDVVRLIRNLLPQAVVTERTRTSQEHTSSPFTYSAFFLFFPACTGSDSSTPLTAYAALCCSSNLSSSCTSTKSCNCND